jgi:hypothetical protein
LIKRDVVVVAAAAVVVAMKNKGNLSRMDGNFIMLIGGSLNSQTAISSKEDARRPRRHGRRRERYGR